MNVALRDEIREMIDKHGQMIQFVHRSSGDPPDFQPFVYTIGNLRLGMPELLYISDRIEGMGDLLNHLGELQRKRGRGLAPGETIKLEGKFVARITDAGVRGRTEYAIQAGVFYETDEFQVCQILLTDSEGRWPEDPACRKPYSTQPLLACVNLAPRG